MPPPDDQRAAYAEETRELCWRGTRTACLLAIPLVPSFAILDAIVFPAQAALFLRIRIACVAALVVIVWLLHRPFGRRHALALGVVLPVAIAGMIDVMTLWTGGETSPYYAGVSLVLVALACVIPSPVGWSLCTSLAVVGGYVGPILLRGPVVDPRMLVNNLFFLGSTALITVVGSALRERLRWQEFINRAALTDALRHKDDFMARMSHELRTPTHVMIGYADILLEEALEAGGAVARGLVERIRSHGVLLHGLISDLLDYAKVEAGKLALHAEPIAVSELVDGLADRFRPLTARKGLVLETRCAADLPALVADRQRVEQILTNLVGNAVKFTERGAVTIEARVGTDAGFTPLAAVVPEEPSGPGVLILVRDTGIGIRDEDVARLAADFEQLEADAAKYGGTGLGLSISRRLAQRLGGRIAVRTRYAEGSTFALYLPLAS